NSFNRDIRFEGREAAGRKIICPYPLDRPWNLKRYRSTDVKRLRAFQERVEFIPLEIFRELKSLERNPSSGLSIVFWIRQFRPLRAEDLFGFSCFAPDVHHHYFDDDQRCAHNGPNEARILGELLG
ncbi:MAG: hypothetical protein O7G30_11155, partial [Proteobacteria bacterium]|nr:hypothetical protein [Pseudomonadota bacterium]